MLVLPWGYESEMFTGGFRGEGVSLNSENAKKIATAALYINQNNQNPHFHQLKFLYTKLIIANIDGDGAVIFLKCFIHPNSPKLMLCCPFHSSGLEPSWVLGQHRPLGPYYVFLNYIYFRGT